MRQIPEVGPGHHWLFEFINEFELHDEDALASRLASSSPFRRLRDIAAAAEREHGAALASARLARGAIVGGVGFEIDSREACHHFRCRLPKIDRQLGEVLHYFDKVIMSGPRPADYLERLDNSQLNEDEYLVSWLREDIRTLNHLHRIGATDYIHFVTKPDGFCCEHHKVGLGELGLTHLADPDAIAAIARKIAGEGGVKLRRNSDGKWEVTFVHPALRGLGSLKYGKVMPPPARQIIEAVIERHLDAMVSDLVMTKYAEAPLVASTAGLFRSRSTSAAEVSVDAVRALLNVPVLAHLTTEQVAWLRREESDAFVRFRLALTAAIEGAASSSGSRDPQAVARSVERDYLEPGIADIDRRLRASGKSTSLKTVVGVSTGLAAVAFGAVASIPLVVAAGVAAAVTPLAQVYKYFDDRQAIELSDMYFLWKAARRAEPAKQRRRR